MNSTIRSTVESAVRSQTGSVPFGYEGTVTRAIDAVTEAVEGLAQQAADSIRESGSSVASPEQIEAALVSAGLVEPEPVVEETPAASGDADRLSKIEEAVARLTALAERHLGSRF